MTLSVQERDVIEYLRQQWDKPLRLTSVEMRLQVMGLAGRSDLRLRIGDYMAARADLHPVVTRWGVPTLVLHEGEKLTGRYLSQRGESGGVRASDLAEAVGCSPRHLELAMTTLKHLKLVQWELEAGQLKYEMAPDWKRRLGPLDFNFHRVELGNGERFNVPCAFDFLLLARSQHPQERIEVSDSCVHCTARIRVVIDRGRIDQVSPPDALLLRGGG